jgi:hypothetical protein
LGATGENNRRREYPADKTLYWNRNQYGSENNEM